LLVASVGWISLSFWPPAPLAQEDLDERFSVLAFGCLLALASTLDFDLTVLMALSCFK
jgi:hypothetical protein